MAEEYIPTVREKVLCAARAFGEREFTAGELVVRAWSDDRATFGLQDHELLYPDANRVLCKIMGSDGLIERGLLQQTGTKRYRVTPRGHAFVLGTKAKPRRLRARGEWAPPGPVRPARVRASKPPQPEETGSHAGDARQITLYPFLARRA